VRRSVFIVAALIGASCALSSGAATASGTPFANAPVLTSRSSPYRVVHANSGHIEFWKVRLSPGDYFSLNGTASPGSTDFYARVFPAGTDDATLHRKSPLVQSRLTGVIGFTASRSGTYPIEFVCANSPTCPSFRFVVSITQEIELVLPNSADLKPSGTFTVSVRTPQGRAVTSRRLIIDLYGLWKDNYATLTHHVLGSAAAIKGKASLKYTLPDSLSGQTISLQATASGQGYNPASSAFRRVKVT
jgi:hypothetical protein